MSLLTDSSDLDASDYRRLIGKRLGNQYDVESFIAEGSYGSVYRGRDAALDRVVAIKIGKEGLSAKNLAGEARRVAKLDDLKENVVQVFGYGTHEVWPYLVMEFLPGDNLEAFWKSRNQRLDAGLMCDFVQQVGTALDAAHSRGLIHRDLKPSNIQVVPKGTDPQSGQPRYRYVLLDFGISALINDSSRTMQNLTQQNAGTPVYMSPEHLHGNAKPELAHLSDVYAFGVILYQLLTGVILFEAKDATGHAAYYQTLLLKEHRPPRFRHAAPDREIPLKVEQLVRRCLEISPERRPQSMGEIVQEFLAAWPKAAKPLPPAKPPLAWWHAALLLTFVLLALGFYFFRPDNGEESQLPPPPETLRLDEPKDALRIIYSDKLELIDRSSVPNAVNIELAISGKSEPAQVKLHLIVCTAELIAAARSRLDPLLNDELKEVHFPKQSFYLSEQLVTWQLFNEYVSRYPESVEEFLWDQAAKSIVLSPDANQLPPGHITYKEYVRKKTEESPHDPATNLHPWMAEQCCQWIAGPHATLPSAAEWDWVCGFTNRPTPGAVFPTSSLIDQLKKETHVDEILRTQDYSPLAEVIPDKKVTIQQMRFQDPSIDINQVLKLRAGDHEAFPATYKKWDKDNSAMSSITDDDSGRVFRIAIPLSKLIGEIRSGAANE